MNAGIMIVTPSPDPWRATVLAWQAELTQRTGSTRTPDEYTRLLARLVGTFGDPDTIRTIHVHAFAYGAGPSGHMPAPSTINVRIAAVSAFFDFCCRMGILRTNPANGVRRPQARPPVPRGLTAAEVRRLLDVLPSNAAGLRDRALIITAVLTGLRRSELLGIRAGDLRRDEDGTMELTTRSKGGYVRSRELPAPALAAMHEMLAAEGRCFDGLARSDRIFAISGQGFYKNLRRYGTRAGVGPVSPHELRHTSAKLRRTSGEAIAVPSGRRACCSRASPAAWVRAKNSRKAGSGR